MKTISELLLFDLSPHQEVQGSMKTRQKILKRTFKTDGLCNFKTLHKFPPRRRGLPYAAPPAGTAIPLEPRTEATLGTHRICGLESKTKQLGLAADGSSVSTGGNSRSIT